MSQKNEFAISVIPHGGIGVTNEKWETIRNLTGSCHELAIQYHDTLLRILVDVGGYQGTGTLERDMKKIARWVSTIVLTHPHMDHIGELATLYRWTEESEHFQGKVISTRGTKMATKSALIDAAKILFQKYNEALKGSEWSTIKKIEICLKIVQRYENRGQWVSPVRKNRRGRIEQSWDLSLNQKYLEALKFLEPYKAILEHKEWKKLLLPKPPFNSKDVQNAIKRIDVAELGKWVELVNGKVFMRFHNAGHIIGSACALFKIIDHQRKPHYVLFTGDIGSYKWDLHINGLPEPPNNLPLDAVVIESTYGGRIREPFEKGRKEFEDSLINAFNDIPNTPEKTWRKAYNQVIISCFSLDRLQNILFRVISLKKAGKINVPIYVDSPLGLEYIKSYVEEAEATLENLRKPKQKSIKDAVWKDYLERERRLLSDFIEYLHPDNLNYVNPKDSNYIRIHDKDARDDLLFMGIQEKRIIITASGMANGGPVMAYLGAFASDPRSAFYFPGYLAEGTLGNQLIQSKPWEQIRVNGAEKTILATMENFTFLSGHGDKEDLELFLRSLELRRDSTIVIVHGDKDESSVSLATAIAAQTKITAMCIVPDINEEVKIRWNGISKARCAEKKSSGIESLIGELEEVLHVQELLLSERIKEADSTSNRTKEISQELYTLEDTDPKNISWEIQRIQKDIIKLTWTINRLRSFKSVEDISPSFMRAINKKYRHDIGNPSQEIEESSATLPPVISQIQLKSLQKKPVKKEVHPVQPEIKEEESKEPQTSPTLLAIKNIIKAHEDDNDALMNEIRTSADRDGIADLKKAGDLIEKLNELQQSLNADRITLEAMNRAQERRSIDDIPATINGEPTDRRKKERLSRLKSDEQVYENASKLAIESLKERIWITEKEIKKVNDSLRDSVGAFRSAEEISSFLITGRLPASRKMRGKELQQIQVQWKISQLRELEKQLEEERETLQANIEVELATLKGLEAERNKNDTILKHIPEYIESLLQWLKKRIFQLRKELSEVEEVDENIWIVEEEIWDITQRLAQSDSLMEQLEELGVVHFPKTKNEEEATYEVYSKKREEVKVDISQIQKEVNSLRRSISAIDTQWVNKVPVNKRGDFMKKQEEKKEWLQRKLEDAALALSSLEQEVLRIGTILDNTPEYLRINLRQQEKSRGQLLEQRKRIEDSGLTPEAVTQKNEEIKEAGKMIDLLSGRFSQKAELISFLEKSGIEYISETERRIKNTERNRNPEKKEIQSTYTIYMDKRKKLEKWILQTWWWINALRKSLEQLEWGIVTIQAQVRQLESTLSENSRENMETQGARESFWLPQVSKVDITQGIELALVWILEKMKEYQKFKRNLTKIRWSDKSDITMTEKKFEKRKKDIEDLLKENEGLRPLIKKKLIQHFVAREIANQNNL